MRFDPTAAKAFDDRVSMRAAHDDPKVWPALAQMADDAADLRQMSESVAGNVEDDRFQPTTPPARIS
jgi:hypothetical protein